MFDKIEQRVMLRNEFEESTGTNWENSQGEPDIDYVWWLESKIIEALNKEEQ